MVPHADALSRLYEEAGSEVPRRGAELSGGVCGVSLVSRPGKPTGKQTEGGRAQHQPLGTVIQGRYFPTYVTYQTDCYPPVRTDRGG